MIKGALTDAVPEAGSPMREDSEIFKFLNALDQVQSKPNCAEGMADMHAFEA
jgi:hypothetical protein